MAFIITSTAPKSKETVHVDILTPDTAAKKKLNKKVREQVDSLNKQNKGALITLIEEGEIRLIAFCPAKTVELQYECLRKAGHDALEFIKSWQKTGIIISDYASQDHRLALAEGFCLSTYSFNKYFSVKDEKNRKFEVSLPGINKKSIEQLEITIQAVIHARDLVNEPPTVMTALEMAASFQKMGREAGFKTEVLEEKQIEALKMGGIMAVNKGSSVPPTFTIMEYKPAKAVNKKPYVLIGKGVSFDSGGLNIKTQSMELMKSDMGGSAAVAGAMYAVAKAKLPVHVIGLVPATDNRPGPDAIAPGDIINTCDGTSVEILNTDAEGRLILADAISYSLRYKPELIIDLATLTGAAVRAIGTPGIVAMGNIDPKSRERLFTAGHEVHERLVEFPLWDEYGEMIKSSVADIANLGGPLAGAITAGKFLEHFTKGWNWIHLDIAGTAFLEKKESYRGKGGSGSAVRLLFRFFQKISSANGK